MKRFAFLISVLMISGLNAAYASKKPSVDFKKAQTEFVDACRKSFRKSTTPTSEEVGKTICECTAEDSQAQGAQASALRKEAAEILKDSKHEIKDAHIMNAFRWCTIELMRKADEANRDT